VGAATLNVRGIAFGGDTGVAKVLVSADQGADGKRRGSARITGSTASSVEFRCVLPLPVGRG